LKALLCKQFGPPESLVLEDLLSPSAGAGEVVISIKAASVNFPDVLIIQNKYQFKPPLPFSPGSELAGVVKEVGAGVSNVKPGDKVIAFTAFGAFAEEVRTEAVRLLPLPGGMSFEEGASFILTYGTTDHALRDRGQIKEGETLLVLGAAGGVGVAAIEIGKALGARVIACASSDDKLAVCRQHGADECINYATEDLRERIKALTGGKGVPVVYDSVGKDTFMGSLDCLQPFGMMVSFGNASGAVPPVDLGILAQKGSLYVTRPTLQTYAAKRDDLVASAKDLMDMVLSGKVKIEVNHRYPLKDAAQAQRDLEARKTTGSTILLP